MRGLRGGLSRAAAILRAAMAAAVSVGTAAWLTGCTTHRPDPSGGIPGEETVSALPMASPSGSGTDAVSQGGQGRAQKANRTGHASDRAPARTRKPHPSQAWAPLPTEPGENGEGSLTFHYSNKSTDANLAIDLGTTDLYLEMTGKPAQEMVEEAKAIEREQDPRPFAPRKKAPPPDPRDDREESQSQEPDPQRSAMHSQSAPQPDMPDSRYPRKPTKPENPPAAEDPGDYEDVTAKVLTGIRKSQELFYQKRYPEAMQAVRSSLEARSTAEGHALAGSIHYMLGQGGMARREWMEALRLNPDMPAVVDMLEKTRTPGGRGSPHPRPLPPRSVPRPAPLPLPEGEQAPFPEEYDAPLDAAPAATPAPVPDQAAPAAPAASAPAEPAPAPVKTGAPKAGQGAQGQEVKAR